MNENFFAFQIRTYFMFVVIYQEIVEEMYYKFEANSLQILPIRHWSSSIHSVQITLEFNSLTTCCQVFGHDGSLKITKLCSQKKPCTVQVFSLPRKKSVLLIIVYRIKTTILI